MGSESERLEPGHEYLADLAHTFEIPGAAIDLDEFADEIECLRIFGVHGVNDFRFGGSEWSLGECEGGEESEEEEDFHGG